MEHPHHLTHGCTNHILATFYRIPLAKLYAEDFPRYLRTTTKNMWYLMCPHDSSLVSYVYTIVPCAYLLSSAHDTCEHGLPIIQARNAIWTRLLSAVHPHFFNTFPNVRFCVFCLFRSNCSKNRCGSWNPFWRCGDLCCRLCHLFLCPCLFLSKFTVR